MIKEINMSTILIHTNIRSLLKQRTLALGAAAVSAPIHRVDTLDWEKQNKVN